MAKYWNNILLIVSNRMKTKYPKSHGVFYTRELLESEAYRELTGTQINVLNIFYLKRQLLNSKTARRLKIRLDSADMVRNNGQIIFTYKEAENLGIKRATFTRSIDKLFLVGFIDIAEQGDNSPSKYAISDRWRKYGTMDSVIKIRHKRFNQRVGFYTRFQKESTLKNEGEITLKK